MILKERIEDYIEVRLALINRLYYKRHSLNEQQVYFLKCKIREVREMTDLLQSL